MRRALKFLLWLSAAFSFLAGLGAAVLTVRSYWISDRFSYNRPMWGIFVLAADGEFRIEHTRVVDRAWPNPDPLGFSHSTDKVDGGRAFPDRLPGAFLWFRWHGFALVTGERWNDDHHDLFLPGWFLTVVLYIPPAIWLGRRRSKSSGRAPGCCALCGYDLRASAGRCPECGAEMAMQRIRLDIPGK